MSNKQIFLVFLFLFALNFYLFQIQPTDYRSFIWFVLIGNFFSSLLINSGLILYTVSHWKKESAKRLVNLIISFVPIVLFHGMAIVFLSFFAKYSELDLMTAQKTLKDEIPWNDVSALFLKYAPIYFPYLLTKITYKFLPESTLYGGFIYVRDAVLLIIASIVVPLVSLKLAAVDSVEFNLYSFCGISLLLFVPWHLFFSRDVRAQKADRVPDFKATNSMPMKVLETGPKGWGFLFMGFGLLAISVSLGTLKISSPESLTNTLVHILFFIPFFIFGLIFFTAGINMQWAEKRVEITTTHVNARVRIFLPWLKIVKWERSLNDYTRPVKDVRTHSGSKGSTSYRTYEIKLKLKTQKPKIKKLDFELDRNVTLYKAYFEDDLETELAAYRQTLSFLSEN